MDDRIERRSLGYLAGSISQLLADRLRRDFLARGIDLTHSQFVLLLDLLEEDGLTQRDLSERIFKDKAAVKRTVDALVAKGLVSRGKAERNVPLHATPRARRIWPRLREIATETVRRSTAAVGAERLEACLSVLRDLQSDLERQERAEGKGREA